MYVILESLLAGATAASALALVVFAVSKIWRRSEVAYWLWLVVLLKFITPGILLVPVAPGMRLAFLAPPLELAAENFSLLRQPSKSARPLDSRHTESEREFVHRATSSSTQNPMSVRQGEQRASPLIQSTSWRVWQVLGCIWLLGSMVVGAISAWRILQFHRAAGNTLPVSDTLRGHARLAARKIGLKKLPDIRLVEARIGPVVWSLGGRPVILLPHRLLRQMNDEKIVALLTHELAHIRRRDHWLVWLEIPVIALHWWNPVAWWCRRQLRQTAEFCCDAIVSRAFPEKLRQYGEALVQSVEFLSTSGPTRLPSAAVGFGEFNSLKRRLTMILEGRVSRPLSQRTICGLIGLSCLILACSLGPVSVQRQTRADDNQAEATQEKKAPAGRKDDKDLKTSGSRFQHFAKVAARRPFPDSIRRLSITTSVGDIQVAPSKDDRLHVTAVVRVDKERTDISKTGKDFESHVSLTETDGVLAIANAHIKDADKQAWAVSLTVETPRSLAVSAATGVGDVEIKVGSGAISLQTGVGDVRLTAQSVKSVTATSGVGDVHIGLAQASGKVDTKSGSGNIALRLEEVTGPVAARTGAGNAALSVLPTTTGRFRLSTGVGSVSVKGLKGVTVKRNVVGAAASGVVGKGGSTYTLQSGVGSVSVVTAAKGQNGHKNIPAPSPSDVRGRGNLGN